MIKINNVRTLERVLEKIKGLWQRNDYYALAVRADRRKMQYMEAFGNSHQLFQDDPCDGTPYNEALNMWDAGELDGTCGIEIASGYYVNEDSALIEKALKAIEEAKAYVTGDDRLYLIVGTSCNGGLDKHEIIVAEAVCLAEVRI
jgi:hypothetical protein